MSLTLIHRDIEDSCGGVDGHVGPNATDDQPSELHGLEPFLSRASGYQAPPAGMNSTEPGLSAPVQSDTQCEEKVPVGMVLRENHRPSLSLLGSETPTGNTLVEMVLSGEIYCTECGRRAQMRCQCGTLVCLYHVYDVGCDVYCGSCVAHAREEMRMQDDLSLEMYKNIARRR